MGNKINKMIPFWTFREYMAEGTFEQVLPVVESLFNRSELALLSATAKTGKTWFGLHLALSVAKGIPFLGRFQTQKGKVLLIQTEVSPASFRQRVAMVEETYGPVPELREEYPLISSERIKLDSPEGLKLFSNSVMEASPSLVILDSWYTFHSKDESLAKDMAPLLTDIREIAKQSNCAILIIHHQGKKGDNRQFGQAGHAARGSSAFADVPDTLLSLTRRQNGQLSLSCEMRNQESPDPLQLRFIKESCTFEILDNENNTENSTTCIDGYLNKLVEAAGSSGVLKAELVQAVALAYQKSERTIEAVISKAIRSGVITKKQEGHQVRYFSGIPQLRSSLKDCKLADNSVDKVSSESDQLFTFTDDALFENPADNLDGGAPKTQRSLS